VSNKIFLRRVLGLDDAPLAPPPRPHARLVRCAETPSSGSMTPDSGDRPPTSPTRSARTPASSCPGG
jgi:hypothetical protein